MYLVKLLWESGCVFCWGRVHVKFLCEMYGRTWTGQVWRHRDHGTGLTKNEVRVTQEPSSCAASLKQNNLLSNRLALSQHSEIHSVRHILTVLRNREQDWHLVPHHKWKGKQYTHTHIRERLLYHACDFVVYMCACLCTGLSKNIYAWAGEWKKVLCRLWYTDEGWGRVCLKTWRGKWHSFHFLLQEGCGDCKFSTFKISRDVGYNGAKSPLFFISLSWQWVATNTTTELP